jgi:hypothetical protein
MRKNYFFFVFLFSFFLTSNSFAQTYNLNEGMVGRMPVDFQEGSFIKIQDSILVLELKPYKIEPSTSEYIIVQDQTKIFEDREIRTLRLLSTSNENLRIHGTIVTGESVRNTLSANSYDMITQVTTPYVIFIEN